MLGGVPNDAWEKSKTYPSLLGLIQKPKVNPPVFDETLKLLNFT